MKDFLFPVCTCWTHLTPEISNKVCWPKLTCPHSTQFHHKKNHSHIQRPLRLEACGVHCPLGKGNTEEGSEILPRDVQVHQSIREMAAEETLFGKYGQMCNQMNYTHKSQQVLFSQSSRDYLILRNNVKTTKSGWIINQKVRIN